MKTIQIHEEVYEYLLKNTSYIGEDASSIMRRLFGLCNRQTAKTVEGKKEDAGPDISPSKMDECLSSPRVLSERDAVGRFLGILSWLHQRHRSDFDKILMIEGRKRKYFANSEAALEESGTSVYPQKIPDSQYWVVTNNDTPKKARMLGDVLKVLGYGQDEIGKVERSLD
jgi:negative modulator of initiation of replication